MIMGYDARNDFDVTSRSEAMGVIADKSISSICDVSQG